MENVKWNGQIYTATDISKSYELEISIEIASKKKELQCPDPDCQNPLLMYCHGEKKRAYFAHYHTCTCDYAEFDKKNTQFIQVKRRLYEYFVKQGFHVEFEVKLLPHHYSHLLFTLPSGKRVAVELGTPKTAIEGITNLSSQYAAQNIDVKWIVIDNSNKPVMEHETYFFKRHALHESKKGDILILNTEGTMVTQYIIDPNKYTYKGKNLSLKNYPEYYLEAKEITDLSFEDDDLTIPGFHTRYNEWLKRKKTAFDTEIVQIKEEYEAKRKEFFEKMRREAPELYNDQPVSYSERNISATQSSSSRSYEERRQSILPRIDQQDEQVKDAEGARWIRCIHCKNVETDDHFLFIFGKDRLNLGECRDCVKRS